MIGVITFLFSFFSGYFFALLISHPEKKKNKLPHIKIKNLEILPNLRIHYKKTTLHIHHWFFISVLAIASFLLYEHLFQFIFVKGATLGSIIQGLRYKDRFNFRYPRTHT